MKTGRTLARFAALLAGLAAGLMAHADTTSGCEGPNHYILSKCAPELRLEWAPVPDSLLAHGSGHAATLLADGRVLVVGGGTWRHDPVTRTNIPQPIGAEVYDPVSRTWSVTAPMSVARLYGTNAVRLLDGRVLVLGGEALADDLQGSAEIFDPASGTWARTAGMIIPRVSFTATLLESGEVLVAGGVDRNDETIAVSEIYNPHSGTWRTAGRLRDARWGHTATILPDGRVLAAGGVLDDFFHDAATTAELFDPKTEAWSQGGPIVQGSWHTATSMGKGWVLVAGGTQHSCPRGPSSGGWCSESNVAATRLFNPDSGEWMDTGTLNAPRFNHLAVPIPARGVLLVGGIVGVTPVPRYSTEPVERLEFFDPRAWTWTEVSAVNELPTSAKDYYSATPLADGSVLLIGHVEGKRAVQLRY
ncbi:MAG TPA: hypothetical protein VFK48_12725 [Usitatibacter sp.]|nr:hypothetical protein [Usitatibacter sp.]